MQDQQPQREELFHNLMNKLRYQSTSTIFMHQAIAEKLRLNPTDHKCMEILNRYGTMTAGELAEYSNLTTGAITGVIDRLEKAGFARRVRDLNDRRRLIIELVPESLNVIEQVFHSIGQETFSLFDRYTDQELNVILDFVTRSTTMATEWTKKMRE